VNPLQDSRTKVVCTVGPASSDEDTLRGLIAAGMDVARLNLAHGEHAEHGATIQRIRRIAEEQVANVALMADLQGPKHRIGQLADGPLALKTGDVIVLIPGQRGSTPDEIPVPHPSLLADLRPGTAVILGDGAATLEIVRREGPERLHCRVSEGGHITSRQGIRAVRRHEAPATYALTSKDVEDLRFALAQQVDFVALSFVGGVADVVDLRKRIANEADGAQAPAIVAKIERQSAVDAIEGIVDVADAIMVARGDLGVEIAPEELPFHQKRIIACCHRAAVPVITATQMLLSMVHRPRPTRAEASDVANAVLDGTDAVMLSEETAVGHHPIEAAQMMTRIVRIAESQGVMARAEDPLLPGERRQPTTDEVSAAAAAIADRLQVKLIATVTTSGYSARRIARARPRAPILALTPHARTARRLALTWGVHPLIVPAYRDVEEMLDTASLALRNARLTAPGDVVIITGGVPFGEGHTNFLKVHLM